MIAVLGFRSAGWFAAGALAAFLIASLTLRKRRPRKQVGLGRPSARSVLAYSVYSGIGTIAIVANNRLDQAILPLVSNTTEMGFYAAAVTISEVPIVFAALAGRNVLPLATQPLPFRDVVREVRFHLLLGFMALAVLFIFADWYVPMLFGAAFLGSVAPLRVLLVSVAFALISNTLVPFISGRGWPGLSSVVPLLGLVPTAIVYALLPRPVPAFAAAVVALFSSAISLIGAIAVCILIENRKVSFAARRWSSRVTRGI
jgi:O-antigen/teichoic acid export membrane protein